jgi:hypothetical protein
VATRDDHPGYAPRPEIPGGARVTSSVNDVDKVDRLVISHLWLRMTIGIVAVLLPVLVLAVVAAREGLVLPSISDSYYHRYANSVFVGSLVAFAAFLWSYKYSPLESRLGDVAAVLAVLVAVFPTPSDGPPTLETRIDGIIHFVSAGGFFLLLAVFCVVWTRDSAGESLVPYYVSAALIGIALLGAVVSKLVGSLVLHDTHAVAVWFLLAEVLVVEAFGFSWLYRSGVQRAPAAWAVLAVVVPSLLIVFLPGSLDAKPLISGFLGLVAVVALLLILRGQQPGAGRNRYAPH